MKTILCYGDSNTYGYIPISGLRYDKNTRWSGILSKKLGDEYEVIEEGCNGRTTVYDEPKAAWKNGKRYIKVALNSHKPIDLVILMLGSNDTKNFYHSSARATAHGVEELITIIKKFTKLKQGYEADVLLICPPALGQGIEDSPFKENMNLKSRKKSLKFPPLYKAVAKRQGCLYLNSQNFIKSSKEDSLHFSPEAHAILAERVYNIVINHFA